jgi:hypothetical protein
MISRSPAEYYIKYMMLLPAAMADADIVRKLRDQQLDYPGAQYLKLLRASLTPPQPFYPTVQTHAPSYRFLQYHRVHKLFFPDEHMHKAAWLLQHPRGKEVIESLLLTAETPEKIVQRLAYLGFQTVTEQAVAYYKHFFLNPELVSPMEMAALIVIRVEDILLEGDDRETQIRYKAMKSAMYSDPRYRAVTSVNKETAAMGLQLRHGVTPDRVGFSKLLTSIQQTGATAVLEAVNRRGPKDAQNARDYMSVVDIASRTLKEMGDGDGNFSKAIIALGTDKREVPGVLQMTEGNYTDGVSTGTGEKTNASK